MKKTLNYTICLFLLSLFSITTALAQKTIMADGHWTKKNTTWDFQYNASITIDSGNNVSGFIVWRIVKTDNSAVAYYRGKLNMVAIENISGSYDVAQNHLQFEGTSKNDPNVIIGLDVYDLYIKNGQITGKTKAGGEWEGIMTGSYTTLGN